LIIRSGLIKNKDTVDFDEFTKHWKEVHGPLARVVPRTRAYSQNHIQRTILDSEKRGLHRIDGISQLRFDTVSDMAVGMDSPEQHACIVDIQGFLSEVTLLIQEEGELKTFGPSAASGRKLMYLIKGDNSALKRFQELLTEMTPSIGGSFRINRVVNREFRVDTTVPAGNQLIDAVLEIILSGKAVEAFNETAFIEKSAGVSVIGVYEVSEHVILPLQ